MNEQNFCLSSESKSVTALLNAWSAGNEAAGNEVVVTVYQQLRRLAASYLKSERLDHTLQATALVHELYLKLFSVKPLEWRNRGHFLAVAARQLRHILVDYARKQHAHKLGGPHAKIALADIPEIGITADSRLVELDRALDRLEHLDARASRVVELRYFGGLTESETAETLRISIATVKRDWELGRSWLLAELSA